ncbi:hypothetical protein AB0H76_31605 [Nocardia sp. NPDC050712]|uniref:hypothetical protein n=1 Tax=Nocardia sp. NPDC050712 TaxID=3155518 RepID=UPI0033EDAC2F
MYTEPLSPERRAAVMAALEAIPALLAELDITLSRADSLAPAGSLGYVRATKTEQALPFNTGAAKAHRDIKMVLNSYTARVAVAVAHRAPVASVDQVRFLARHLPRIPDDSEALAGLDVALARAVQGAYRTIDRPESLSRIGDCVCGVGLYSQPDIDIVRCGGCGIVVSVRQQRRQLLNQAYEMMGTAAELARIVPDGFGAGRITAERIRQWARRGKLTGRVVGNRTVYRLGDVLELCTAQRSDLRRSA